MIKFDVSNQQLLLLSKRVQVVADSQGYLIAQFQFTEDWNDVVKIAIFTRDDYKLRRFLDENGCCIVPWEVLKGAGQFNVTVVGNNRENEENKVITTNGLAVSVAASGLTDGEVFDESSEGIEGSVLYQITAKATLATEKAENAAASAEAAERWATSDAVLDGGLLSAKKYAEAASLSATNAGQSKTAAETAAGNASDYKDAALRYKNDAEAALSSVNAIVAEITDIRDAPRFHYDANGDLYFVLKGENNE